MARTGCRQIAAEDGCDTATGGTDTRALRAVATHIGQEKWTGRWAEATS
jgi:hypothetical protein